LFRFFNKKNLMKFWDRVKIELKNLGKTQRWLAEQIHEEYDTLRNWIYKGILPNIDQAYAISDALGVPISLLAKGEPQKASGVYEEKILSRPVLRQIVDRLMPFNEHSLHKLLPVIDAIYLNRDFAEIKQSIG